MEEYLTTPMFSPSRTVGSPPASDAFRMSSHVATLGSSLRPPLFTADAPSNGSPVRPVYPLGLHLPSTGGVAPAWASGLAGIALERPGSAVALPVDSKEQVLSMSMQSKLHAFQCGLDNQAHLIKQLRREVDGKQEVRRPPYSHSVLHIARHTRLYDPQHSRNGARGANHIHVHRWAKPDAHTAAMHATKVVKTDSSLCLGWRAVSTRPAGYPTTSCQLLPDSCSTYSRGCGGCRRWRRRVRQRRWRR
jgi:hypothetical protein